MHHICIEFQENYKALDNLCKQCYSSSVGVTEYIDRMDESHYRGKMMVEAWDKDYKTLKHLRWVRNQLAHEIGAFESGICTEEELVQVRIFYNRIISGNDPLTLLRKAQERKGIRTATDSLGKGDTVRHSSNSPSVANSNVPHKPRGLFRKIVDKIKQLF